MSTKNSSGAPAPGLNFRPLYVPVCVRVCAWRMVYQEHKTPSAGATRHCSLHTPSAYAYKLLSA